MSNREPPADWLVWRENHPMKQETKNRLIFGVILSLVVAIIVILALAPAMEPWPQQSSLPVKPVINQLTVKDAIVSCYSFGSDFVSASGDVTLPPNAIAIKEATGKTLWIANDCTVEEK